MTNFSFKSLTMKTVALVFLAAFFTGYSVQSVANEPTKKEVEEHGHSHKADETELASHTENTVHQYSPTIALLNSIYEGDITPQQMVQQGNIGLGTVNQLAGELIAVDGIIYTIDAEGGIKVAPNDLKSPNMTMINFQPKQTIEIKNIASLEDLNTALNKYRTSKNSFYAYKIKGEFSYLKMASAHKVENEDVSIFEYLDTRVMYTKENIKGTLVGLFTPKYLGNIVIPGLHLHFLSEDIKLGGHLEDIKFDNLTIEVQEVNQVNLQLPNVEKFRTRELKEVAPPKATAKPPVGKALEVKGSDFSLSKKWEVSGFKMPESVFASADHPWLYVSNVNGKEPGFISRVAKDGTIDNLMWTTGLNSPTGSDIYKNELYVSDAKQLHVIDLETGKITESFTAADAVSLNDVTIDQRTGEVFISDVPGGKVYHLKNGKLSVWFEASEIPYPNGVLVQGSTLIVANYATKNGKGLMRKQWGPDDFGTIYKIDIATKAVLDIQSTAQKGGYDGVVEFNGVLMASSNPTGQIFTFEGNKSYLIDSTDKGVADINTDGKTIYAPYLFDNKLIAFEPVAWDRVTTKEEYLEKGADNYYGDAGGKSIATHDGIIKGIFGGLQLTGTWDWEGEYFCRTSMLGKMDLGSDCIQIDVTEDKMRLVLNKGKGMSVVYDKKPKTDQINEQSIDSKEDTMIQMVGRFQMKAEGRAKFRAAMLEVVKGTVNEPDALAIRMFEDANNPDLLFGLERFKDFSAVEYHRKQPYELALIDVAGTSLSVPPVAYVFGPAVVEEVRAPDEQKVDPSELYVVALFDIKPDQFDRVVAQYKKQIPNIRKHEGSISFNAYTVLDNPTQLVVVEWWKSAEVARQFSTTDPLSIETGKILKESLERPIPEYLHELREVNP